MYHLNFYQLYFTDMLNQRVKGGKYLSFTVAILTARGITSNGLKSSFEIVRESDGVTIVQSKAVQP